MFLKLFIYLNIAASIGVFLLVSGDLISNENNQVGCILPNHPLNGKWEIIGRSDVRPGSTVPTDTIISFSCDENYKILGDNTIITCFETYWDLPPPECLSSEDKIRLKRKASKKGNRKSLEGGRGGDGIVIESGGRTTVIGPGDSSSNSKRGQGGQGGIGVITGGVRIGGGKVELGSSAQKGNGRKGNKKQKEEKDATRRGGKGRKKRQYEVRLPPNVAKYLSYSPRFSTRRRGPAPMGYKGGDGVRIYEGVITGDIQGFAGHGGPGGDGGAGVRIIQ